MPLSTDHPRHEFSSADEAVSQIREVLDKHQRFLICGHVRPDGDCIGSTVAMCRFLQHRGKEVRLFFRGPILDTFGAIAAGVAMHEEIFPSDYQADVTLCLDCGSADRIIPDFNPHGIVVNIDHHHGNTRFGHINWIGAQYAAVGEMVYLLIQSDPTVWTPEIASCLYLALVTDTGAFRYANTTANSFKVAARLVEEGADPSGIADKVWGNRKMESVLIAAGVWNNLHFELNGKFVWSEITQALFQENGGENNEPDNLVSELLGIEGVEVALLFRETAGSGMRASLRSREGIDVSAIAAALGGGGHKVAAGYESKGPYVESRARVLEVSRVGLKQQIESR